MDWTLIRPICIGVYFSLVTWCTLRSITGTGKYITQPMVIGWYVFKSHRHIKRVRRDNPDLKQFSFRYRANGTEVRLVQLGVLFLFGLVPSDLIRAVGTPNPDWVDLVSFWLPAIALYLDDIITSIDKGKWKKRWQAVKNKLNWKWTPAPVPSHG